MRHVIIEGPDGAGKTALAKWLAHRHVLAYHHEGPPPDCGKTLVHHYGRLLLEASRPTVFDRFHLGETIYGPLLRGQSKISREDLTLMRRLIRGTGTQLVFCLPSWDVCRENNRHKTELINDEAKLREAYVAWDQLVFTDEFGRGALIHNYTHAEPIAHGFRWPLQRCPWGVIGSPNATVLFVGEQPKGDLDLPFFGYGFSSGYLNGAIRAAQFHEDQVAFTNARRPDQTDRRVVDLIEQMPQLKAVVALGKIAADAVSGAPAFVKLFELSHPAYWRRFHFHETQTFIDRLEEVRRVA